MISNLCKGCVYCIEYEYMRYSMMEGKEIHIKANYKCEKTVTLEFDISSCSHFKEKQDTKEKPKQSAKLSMSCVQPSNHGRKGAMPRSREGCFKKKEIEIKDEHGLLYP